MIIEMRDGVLKEFTTLGLTLYALMPTFAGPIDRFKRFNRGL